MSMVKVSLTFLLFWESAFGRSIVRNTGSSLHWEVGIQESGQLVQDRQEKRIYYWRDNAGLNNVRLQFESLVVTAAVSNRRLMIPPPSGIAHIEGPFMETYVWKSESLAEAINFSLRTPSQWPPHEQWCPEGAHSIGELENTDLSSLPAEKDWCFGQDETRVRHFECSLKGISDSQQATAQTAVFNGLQVQGHYVQGAKDRLVKLGMQEQNFVAAHLRMGDFMQSKMGVWSIEAFYPALNRYAAGKPLLIITDDDSGSLTEQIKDNVQASEVHSASAELGEERTDLQAAVEDILLGSMAGTFIGSPGSTFSLAIRMLRTKEALCMRGRNMMLSYDNQRDDASSYRNAWFDLESYAILDEDADPTQCDDGSNWNKQATFSKINLANLHC